MEASVEENKENNNKPTNQIKNPSPNKTTPTFKQFCFFNQCERFYPLFCLY